MHALLACILFLCAASPVSSANAATGDGITWDRFRVRPALSIAETYNDNIYLSTAERRHDIVTSCDLHLPLDIAIRPDNYITLSYDGRYSAYRTSDNFKKDTHKAGGSWQVSTPKGSRLTLGASVDFDSVQPFSARDLSKGFTEKKWFGETILMVSGETGIGASYEFASRDFRESRYSVDDYERNSIALRAFSRLRPDTEITMAYSYFHQDNTDIPGIRSDVDSHVFLIGVAWDPSRRVYGNLEGGYYRMTPDTGDYSDGIAVDTHLGYRLTESTVLDLTVFRRATPSTRTARESGIYYTSTGGGVSVTYSGFADVTCTLDTSYRHNEFTSFAADRRTEREDDFIDAGLAVRYAARRSLSLAVGYHYRMNLSTIDSEEYRANIFQIRISIAL